MYIADLRQDGKQLSTPIRLTQNEGWNAPVGWTGDSKTVVYLSDRSGHPELLGQVAGEETVKSIARLEDSSMHGRISPDGAWVLYLTRPNGWARRRPLA